MLGAQLGNYRVLEKLGEGGMGIVYLGRHETLGHPVAIKVLRAELSVKADIVQRFFNEAQTATSIRNPGIVQIFDFGRAPDGSIYFAMELLEGTSLAGRLQERRVDHAECCRIGRQVANVLQAAHARGITHRDLKPDNLFLVPDSEVIGGERVKVLDFGIAKLANELEASGVRTATGLMMGTPRYMSPEQCRGAGAVDARSDIYSLGCILFEMVCGRPPFVGGGAGEVVGAHQHVPVPHPQTLAPDLPPALAALILAMLDKQPSGRPQTMAAVGQALDEIGRSLGPASRGTVAPTPPDDEATTTLGGSVGMFSMPPLPTSVARPSRRRLALLVVACLVVAGVAGVVVAVLASRDPRPTSVATVPAADASADAAAIVEAQAVIPPSREEAAEEATAATAEDAAPARRDDDASRLNIECLEFQSREKWDDLLDCAIRLAAIDDKLAAPLKAAANREISAQPHHGRFDAALDPTTRDIKKARVELEAMQGSVYYDRYKAKYEVAETASIEDLAKLLRAKINKNCRDWNALARQEAEARGKKIVDEAKRLAPCRGGSAVDPCKENPAAPGCAVASPPAPCDSAELMKQGTDAYASGAYNLALTVFEKAVACNGNAGAIQRAFMSACKLVNRAKAKYYYTRSPTAARPAMTICTAAGITDEELKRAP